MRRKKKNIVLEKVLVEDYAAEGRSLARVNGKVIFIERTVPGDVVDVKLFKNKKDWAEGWPLQFHTYSSDRLIPFCTHFGVCGGCQWQMLPYQKQLAFKQQQVQDNLHRIGKIPLPTILPIIGADETQHYRNKLEYAFATNEYLPLEEFQKQKAESHPVPVLKEPLSLTASAVKGVAGFHAKGSFDKVVDIQNCYLQAEPSNALRMAVKKFALENGLDFYDMKNHRGFIRAMQLRICTTGEVMVNIVLGYDDERKRDQLLDFILKKFPTVTTLLYTINTKLNDSLYDLQPVVYHGKGYVMERLENFQFRIGPLSFFQTNTKQAEKLYQVTRDFAGLTGQETVYDLYCGTGSIGIFVSPRAKKIIGVDVIPAAIEDARQNASLNQLHHAAFFAGDVIDICQEDFFAAQGKPDVVITDPPRAGMHGKLLDKILDIEAPRVVYVSCNPATQARDLNILGVKYEVTKIQPMDMFPHTHHIENVVQLQLKR
jgi:23S rRNA (uracil1939-C5)-methyltransferase